MPLMKNILILVVLVVLVGAGYVFMARDASVPPPQMPGEILTDGAKKLCGITAEVTEGPYYISGTPALTDGNLNYAQLPGNSLTISGFVYEGVDTTKPLANATLDIWQADHEGDYHPNAQGQMSDFSVSDIALRGGVTTDATGFYTFSTVYPGEYSGRARHMHVKIRADGFKEITSQLILALPGDAISFDEDTVSEGLPTCHLLSLDAQQAPRSATFDFHLDR
jgi:protocatechuate 3,4-dioxygenase beta subunit